MKKLNKRNVKAAVCRVFADAIADERDYCANDGVAALVGDTDENERSDLLDYLIAERRKVRDMKDLGELSVEWADKVADGAYDATLNPGLSMYGDTDLAHGLRTDLCAAMREAGMDIPEDEEED